MVIEISCKVYCEHFVGACVSAIDLFVWGWVKVPKPLMYVLNCIICRLVRNLCLVLSRQPSDQTRSSTSLYHSALHSYTKKIESNTVEWIEACYDTHNTRWQVIPDSHISWTVCCSDFKASYVCANETCIRCVVVGPQLSCSAFQAVTFEIAMQISSHPSSVCSYFGTWMVQIASPLQKGCGAYVSAWSMDLLLPTHSTCLSGNVETIGL